MAVPSREALAAERRAREIREVAASREAELRALLAAEDAGAEPTKNERNPRQWQRTRRYWRGLNALSAARRKAGLCPRCGEPPEAGRAHCAACLEQCADRVRSRKARRRAAGLCPQCGGEPEPGRAACSRCLARRREYARARRAARGAKPRMDRRRRP